MIGCGKAITPTLIPDPSTTTRGGGGGGQNNHVEEKTVPPRWVLGPQTVVFGPRKARFPPAMGLHAPTWPGPNRAKIITNGARRLRDRRQRVLLSPLMYRIHLDDVWVAFLSCFDHFSPQNSVCWAKLVPIWAPMASRGPKLKIGRTSRFPWYLFPVQTPTFGGFHP